MLKSVNLTLGLTVFAAALMVASLGPGWAAEVKTFRDCSDCPEMAVVPAGSVVLELPYVAESERRPIEVPSFAIARHEITIDEWDQCVDAGSCSDIPQQGHWIKTGQHPITNMTQSQANDYVRWLSSRTSINYRLLSEIEWEYAARGGAMMDFTWGNESVEPCPYGNHDDVSYKSRLMGKGDARRYARCDDGFVFTAPVGSLRPNDFGLYDMGGNVWEWTASCWAEFPLSAQSNGEPDCEKAVIRGGSFRGGAPTMSPSFRASRPRDFSNVDIGFRVGRDL